MVEAQEMPKLYLLVSGYAMFNRVMPTGSWVYMQDIVVDYGMGGANLSDEIVEARTAAYLMDKAGWNTLFELDTMRVVSEQYLEAMKAAGFTDGAEMLKEESAKTTT